MSPYQHGEVFVTDDGAETDLDLGHYERFIDENLTVNSYRDLRQGVLERAEPGAPGRISGGHHPGHPPHHQRDQGAHLSDGQHQPTRTWCITEIGGTVGDIESQPFLEAIRQVGRGGGRGRTCMYIHVSLVVSIPGSGELKSKPTQHSVQGAAEPGHPARRHRLPRRTSP